MFSRFFFFKFFELKKLKREDLNTMQHSGDDKNDSGPKSNKIISKKYSDKFLKKD